MHTSVSRSSHLQIIAASAAAFLIAVFGYVARVAAQDAIPSATPGAASSAETGGSTLFPAPGYTPAPELDENRPLNRGGRRGGGGGRHGLAPGQAGRATDLLSARAASDPITVRIAFRKAKTEAILRHPELIALQQQAADAGTDREKREYLRAYYTQLYSAVQKVDSSPAMTSHVNILSSIAAQRYDPKRRAVGGDEDLVRGKRGGRRH